ncbi:hypothetical protein FJW07_04590 [Mesorhizobium sp. B3-1-9]|uniref:hypothetical protein n=1 Tax=unclassified Mesorhizobium TaxID=325217 RepID=UPI001127A7B4|nr:MULTISPECIES: hypothetical protein [unclassified Mesorhizobium]TPI24520.1 hypothetical protein FJ414_31120 [Mesorhizobium sp. B3-1-6]TPI41793.1 hypothetical protein FJW07_04590 [Mesorhizobium sp. B3-1-9]TPI55684.1 hypothetical protein FJ417_23925 [Mesorhizobium sp. B3-1-7]TPI69119.1 hypothetical protein FJ424_06955 [Mesorhizobium sp. B3-1-8]TPI74886.1 hypothetical protein FJ420_04870 [Mesorhizobium sp. B3-1-3]
MSKTAVDDDERRARQEAYWLVREFGAEAPLYAAMKAEKAIEQKDFGRCARWKRVLEILADKPPAELRRGVAAK